MNILVLIVGVIENVVVCSNFSPIICDEANAKILDVISIDFQKKTIAFECLISEEKKVLRKF